MTDIAASETSGRDELRPLLSKVLAAGNVCPVDELESFFFQLAELRDRPRPPEGLRQAVAKRWYEALAACQPFGCAWQRAVALVTVVTVIRATQVNTPVLYDQLDPQAGEPYTKQLAAALSELAKGMSQRPSNRTRWLWLLAAVAKLDQAAASSRTSREGEQGQIASQCDPSAAASIAALAGEASEAPAWLRRRLAFAPQAGPAATPTTAATRWRRFWCGGDRWTMAGWFRLAAAACCCAVVGAAAGIAWLGYREINAFRQQVEPLARILTDR